MEAKETVMGNKKLQLLGQQYEDEVPTCDLNHYLLSAQAEISFKAGRESVMSKRNFSEEFWYGEGKMAGIQEVVEHIQECEKRNPDFYSHFQVEKFYWQAKIKE